MEVPVPLNVISVYLMGGRQESSFIYTETPLRAGLTIILSQQVVIPYVVMWFFSEESKKTLIIGVNYIEFLYFSRRVKEKVLPWINSKETPSAKQQSPDE